MAMKMGMLGIIFGVLLLVVGLVLSDIIIDQVNKQGGRIGCYDGSDVPITNANTWNQTPSTPATAPVPKKVSKTFQGPDNVGQVCGSGGVFTAAGVQTNQDRAGTVRYSLEVYGADSLNNLFTLVYWIVLVGISLSLVGAGGYGVARGARGAF